MPAVALFQRCQLSYVSGGMGAICTGISCIEIETCARLLNLPMTPELAEAVLLMGRAAAAYLNRKMADEKAST